MRIVFHGHDFDLFDEKIRRLAANQAAVDKMLNVNVPEGMQPDEALVSAFEELLTNLLDYWLMSGATLQSAKATGCAGLTMDQALEQHNYLGALVGQQPLELVDVSAKPEG